MLDLSSVKHPIQHIQWVQKLLCESLHRIVAVSPAAAPQTHTGCSYETAAVQSVIGIVNKKCLDLCIRQTQKYQQGVSLFTDILGHMFHQELLKARNVCRCEQEQQLSPSHLYNYNVHMYV